MKFKEIISRLTGFSCPVFGISWNPTEADISVCRRIITYFEDRRVLYVPYEVEVPQHCVDSIIKIRRFLTNELSNPGLSEDIENSLRAMRGACRKFLTRVQNDDRDIIKYGNQHRHFASWIFIDAVGQLRGTFGIHIAQLAVKYGLDVEDDLAQIFPELDDNEKANQKVD